MTLLVVGVVLVPAIIAPLVTGYLSPSAQRWLSVAFALTTSTWAAIAVNPSALPAFAVLAAAWGAATAVDLAEHRLPDALTLIPIPLFFALQVPWAVLEGGWGRLGSALLGSLLTAAILFVLAYINPSGFGLGDVKLGLTTGAALGWFGIGTALLGVAAAFILMAVISGLLLATEKIKREAEIAFGPFMILGVLVTPWAGSLLGW
ncbi:prepilin peptidase [Tessaracoccus sp. Y1736]